MQAEPEPKGDWARHAIRINSVIDNQVRSLRKRLLLSSYSEKLRTGTYWGVPSDIADYPAPGALPCPVEKTTPVVQAQDFGFRYERGSCVKERLDTLKGVFTKNLGGSKTVTARISLSESEMRIIYEKIQEIGFLNFPSKYEGSAGLGAPGVTMTIPSETYRLEVRNGGIVHTVLWEDDLKPTTEEADRFRSLIDLITGIIHDRPEFKRLPKSNFGCM
jgi:hypothetical protein